MVIILHYGKNICSDACERGEILVEHSYLSNVSLNSLRSTSE